MVSTRRDQARARVFAVDWSGRSGSDQRRAIWLAEAVDGKLVRLEDGRTRSELVDELIAEAARDPNLIVGIDFALSLPAWYLLDRGLTARQLWATLADEALTPTMKQVGLAEWMKEPEPPFWKKRKADAQLEPGQEFRRTDNDVRAAGTQPKSVFQLVGGGQVGPGSLYGMQILPRLSAAGSRIWPFDPPGMPLVVEMFPRLLTGPVIKSDRGERERYLASVPMSPTFRDLATNSDDAFDAAVSALGMAAAIDELIALPDKSDYALEGKIWQPRQRASWNRAHAAAGTRSTEPADPVP